MDLSFEVLNEWLSYDPETGDLFWKKKPARQIAAGAKAGCKCAQGYVLVRVLGTLIRAHRAACILSGINIDGVDVDHVDGNGLNNRLANLRPCSHSQNMHNAPSHKDNLYSKWKGVSFDPKAKVMKWYARLYVNGKSLWLGSFKDEREAAEAYIFAALEHHGEFARFE
jgi:hypothetical protein